MQTVPSSIGSFCFTSAPGVYPLSSPWPHLVCPVTAAPLAFEDGETFVTPDGRRYPAQNGIANLLSSSLADQALQKESQVFENIPVKGEPYFREEWFERNIQFLDQWMKLADATAVEIGGGEGHWASCFKKYAPKSRVYVCDISRQHLELADASLIRVQCDARYPYLAPNTVDLAAFWVSLHHFSKADALKALAQAYAMLKPKGLLLIFEPNASFFPRQILLNTPLKKLVYFDEDEKALSCRDIQSLLQHQGFQELSTTAHNPPYNSDFLKQLKWPWLFGPVTETFFRIEKAFKNLPLNLGSYVLSLWQKPIHVDDTE